MRYIRYGKHLEPILDKIYNNITEVDSQFFFPSLNDIKSHEAYLLRLGNEYVGFYFVTGDSFGLYICPDFRNRGYGRNILRRIKGPLTASVVKSNIPALNLYMGCGFRIIGEYRDGRGEHFRIRRDK